MESLPLAISSRRPHAVCIPYPAQGHINPMLKLAKLLHHKGFHITFVNTEYNNRRLIKSRGPDSVKGLPDFHFKTIPDGLPPTEDIDATQDVPALCDSTSKNCFQPFRDLIFGINKDPNLPPVSCIVSDGIMSFTLSAAKELGIPDVLFWTTSACGFMSYLQFHHLIQQDLVPLKDSHFATNGYLDTPVNWIPGLKDLRVRDLPSFIRTTDPNDFMIKYLVGEIERVPEASAIVLNTFEELENDVIIAIKSMLPQPVYSIGSLHLLVKQISDKRLNAIGSSLWKEEPESLQGLDTKKSNSVVYVNFGSITLMTPQQMIEFAWGLANSKHTFLWVVRPDLVSGDTAVFTSQLIKDTEDRGLLVSWCPQEQVLSHPSIGGFLTHCGWNSTLESICSGVPMICWPFFAEQQMNCRYSCVHWGVGKEIDNNVKRDEVESLVRELMDGKKDMEMKMNAIKWKNQAAVAATTGGSSYENIDKFVSEILIAD